jgi:hypothetical protein
LPLRSKVECVRIEDRIGFQPGYDISQFGYLLLENWSEPGFRMAPDRIGIKMPGYIFFSILPMLGGIVSLTTDNPAGDDYVSSANSLVEKGSMTGEVENYPVNFTVIFFGFHLKLAHQIAFTFHRKGTNAAFQQAPCPESPLNDNFIEFFNL